MENFEQEKIKIKILIRDILSNPLNKSAVGIPHISIKETQRLSDIFWDAAKKFPAFSYETLAQLAEIFPVALLALEGNFSEERVKYVAEILMEMKNNLLKTGDNSPPTSDNSDKKGV